MAHIELNIDEFMEMTNPMGEAPPPPVLEDETPEGES